MENSSIDHGGSIYVFDMLGQKKETQILSITSTDEPRSDHFHTTITMLQRDQRGSWMVASHLQKRWLLTATNAVAATSIFFFGQSPSPSTRVAAY